MAVGRSRRILMAAMALLLTAGLAACGGDDDNAEDTTTTAAPRGEAIVDVEMKDFAYTVSGSLTKGGTLRVENTGKELHMITVTKFKPGKTATDLVKAFQQAPKGEDEGGTTTSAARAATTTSAAGGEEEEEDDPTAEIVDDVENTQGGAGIFAPGAPAVELTPTGLESGDYALMCFINVEGEEALHAQRGMVATLKVVEGTAPAPPTADATYKIEKGKAITGPTTLTAGRHVLKLEATGEGAGDLEPTLLKPNAGKTFADVNRVFESWDEGGIPKGGATSVPALLVAALFDLGEQTTYYITTEFTAGTYQLVGTDSDVDNPPMTPKELITIRVT